MFYRGRLERAGQSSRTRDAVEPERAILARPGIIPGDVPPAGMIDQPERMEHADATPVVTGGVVKRDRPVMADRVSDGQEYICLRRGEFAGFGGENERLQYGVQTVRDP